MTGKVDKGPVEKVLETYGFSELNPVQKQAVDSGLLDGGNMVVSAPTASGKTLIAEIAMMNTLMKGKKTLYIVPLKALASEKYNEFREKYEKTGAKVTISVGDLDSSDSWIAGYDVIIVTSEKLDSLIRHGAPWLDQVGLVVADEIHLIDSPNRGPTLEVILTKLRQLMDPQILALSATISNHEELAEWLGAKALKSDYRPVKLYMGLFCQGKVDWHPEREKLTLPADLPPVFEISKDTLKKEKQSIVFVSTRKRAESLSEKLADMMKKMTGPEEKSRLARLSYEISHVLERPTKQCERLARCIQGGSVFHHAGLVAKQRKLIEENFRKGLIKVICATPTLAAGVNMPAYRVVIRDLKRFSSFRGMDYIPVLEIHQMMGRAGRPAFDSEGEAILVATSASEAKKLWNEYIQGEPEKIISKLGVEPVLRMHVLSLIATDGGLTREELMDFFSRTFYAFQYGDTTALDNEIDKVVEMLEGFGFITREGNGGDKVGEFMSASAIAKKDIEMLKPTRVGKRVAELYIDPLTADHIIKSTEKMRNEKKTSTISVLNVLAGCLEMRPGVSVRKKDMESDEETLIDFMLSNSAHIVGKIPSEWEMEYDGFLREMKLVWLLNEWADETGEDRLLEKFGVTPGELRSRLEISDWLFFSMQELSVLLNRMDITGHIRKARLRIKYGIKEELLPLVKLRGIGRVRARMLFNNGFRSIESLRKAPVTSLTRIVGPKTAKTVKRQLEGPASQINRRQETF